jgi:transcriptional regulator with GAF, ATPase, and Fis domain
LNEANDQNDVVLANLPASRVERRLALAVGLVLLGIGVVIFPFGRVRLPESNAWAPTTDTFIFVADLITWFLLISQFNIVRTRALLVLASGYLFAAAINIPHLLTFPGAYSPTGLLGAGLQTSVWLAIFWMSGYPLAVVFYSVMKKEPRTLVLHGSSRNAVAASIAVVIAIVLALTWIAIAGDPYLPKLLANRSEATVSLRHVSVLLLLPNALALLLIWFRGRSVLDLWLTVVMCGWMGQGIAQINTPGRFSLAMYAARTLFAISSTVVLVVLLKETMTLYGRLAVSLVALRRLSAEKLQRSEAYLSEAQRLSHTGSFGRDVSSGEIHWSAETYKIFELDRSVKPTLELLFERIHPDDRHHVQQTIGRAANEKTDFDIECRFLRPDDSVKYLHIVAQAFEHASGEMEFVGAVTDITQRKRAEEALRKAFEEIKSLRDQLYRENLALKAEVDHASMFEEVVGTSPALRAVLALVSKVAPTDSTVLITGETGTGKELIARAVHKRSRRSTRAFVSVNCAAIPRDLIGSELFGHEKGAFTGAIQRRIGCFELAEGGTIFLDEIGELPAETQIALLRVLQEREFERVGGAGTIRTNVRVIAATNRDLEAAIAAGMFRSDLYYRLNVFPIEMPPLRERREDIPLLVEYFIDRFARKAGKSFKTVSKKSLALLESYTWPGNIRELQNVIERSVIVCDTENFSVDESWLSRRPPATEPNSGSGPFRKLPSQEKAIIEEALRETGGQVYGPDGAASKLGMPRSTLESKIRSLKINKNLFKATSSPLGQ